MDVDGSRNHQTRLSKTRDNAFLTLLTDISNEIPSLISDCFTGVSKSPSLKENKDVFEQWRNWRRKIRDTKRLDDIMNWLEWVLSQTLLRISETNTSGMEEFWLYQGSTLLLNLLKSSQEDVQEKAATGLLTFVVVDDENVMVNPARAEAITKDGGIPLLLELAKSCKEGIKCEAIKVIANLFVNAKVAKAVAD